MRDLPEDALIWVEIPVTDLERAMAFYGAVLETGFDVSEDGPNPIAMFPVRPGGRAGHLYPGTPAADGTGPTPHLFVERLEPALERAAEAGGRVLPGIFPLPVGRFAYMVDPDGNSIGLFEPKKDG